MERVHYDEFGLFHENAGEFGIPFDTRPVVRRITTAVSGDRTMSSLVWGATEPELVLLHGGGQNAHTWDTVALALDRPLLAIDLPGHGHSDAGSHDTMTPETIALDVATVIRSLAPNATTVVGMSLGGLTAVALTLSSPMLVRKMVLVDITPGVNAQKSSAIANFVRGPATFASLDELLQRTVEHNPGRSESSLRRGILHNALQLDDGSWMWRYRRFSAVGLPGMPEARANIDGESTDLPHFGRLWTAIEQSSVPLLLARGMRPQSVVDDADVAELIRRRPDCQIVEFPDAGHSVQGDSPVELARTIAAFASA